MIPKDIRILIVDDMLTIRQMVSAELQRLGFSKVREANDGHIAYDLVRTENDKKTPFDLIISDWNMPNLTGIELLKRVRGDASTKATPFILLTSEGEREQVTEAILAGVSQYIVKPFAAKTLLDKLEAAWTKHHPNK